MDIRQLLAAMAALLVVALMVSALSFIKHENNTPFTNESKSTFTYMARDLESGTITKIWSFEQFYMPGDTVWVDVQDYEIQPNDPYAMKYIILPKP